MNTKIAKISTYPLNVPIDLAIAGATIQTGLSCVVIEIETVDGIVGHGFTAITEEEVVAQTIDKIITPAILGHDALHRERIAEILYWLLTPRGQTGYASHAISCIDLALWDILGQVTQLPCATLLGNARAEVPLYVTFGFGAFDREQLSDVAKQLKTEGVNKFKMVVGHHALKKRIMGGSLSTILEEDIWRVKAVREAIGKSAELFIDANCSLDPLSAQWLVERLSDCDITFFEEPIRDNDARQLVALRHATGIRIAAGQNEGQIFRFNHLLDNNAVDVLQPNVVICGGLTAGAKVAALAESRNVTLANGGAFPFHNMHLHAGLAHGGLVEWHLVAVALCQAIFKGLPEPQSQRLAIPNSPGLGFTLNKDNIKEIAKRPLSAGAGKA